MMKIITSFPDAVTSPDYIAPIGAKQDNHSSEHYISELKRIANDKPFSYLDLGCAGGQSVVDVYELGYVACGVEGSDLNKMLNNSTHGVADNWKKYKDKCLFKADITKPFEIKNDNDELQKFDIITAWDVLEHPKEEDIPNVIINIALHMHENSVFIALVNTVHGSHHQCVKPREWWIKMFDDMGMIDVGFDMAATPRNSTPPIICENDIGFMFKLK